MRTRRQGRDTHGAYRFLIVVNVDLLTPVRRGNADEGTWRDSRPNTLSWRAGGIMMIVAVFMEFVTNAARASSAVLMPTYRSTLPAARPWSVMLAKDLVQSGRLIYAATA